MQTRKFWSPRRLIVCTALMLAATPVLGHDLWLQPVRFSLPDPGEVGVTMFVGHGPDRERWGVASEHIVLFKTVGPDGLVDQRPNLRVGQPNSDAFIRLKEHGAYIVGLQSRAAVSDLPALRFDDYVATEGISPIATHRKQTGAKKDNGREFYSRRAKAIVQVGSVKANDVKRVTTPVRLKLEIVPGKHPSQLKRGEVFPVKVLYNGKGLRGALVKLTDLRNDARPVRSVRTDQLGRANFVIPRSSQWQLNVVWADVLNGDKRADYSTTFSSLSFETS